MIDEKKIAGASYILNFFKEVHTLTDYYSQYLNILKEIETKLGKEETDLTKLEEHQKTTLIQICQFVRQTVTKSYIHYKTIEKSIAKDEGKEESLKSKKLYDELMKDLIVKRNKLEEYVLKINSVLVESVIQELLNTSQALLEEIYSSEGESTSEDKKVD